MTYDLKAINDSSCCNKCCYLCFCRRRNFSVATRVFDADGVPGTAFYASATTNFREMVLMTWWYSSNAATAITTPLSEEDFAHVAAE